MVAPCHKCQKRVTYSSGIICANFGETRCQFPKCNSAWCTECFVPHELDLSEVKVPVDFHGASLEELEDNTRFMQARPGDHLCTLFQCPDCQSQNIRGRTLKDGMIADECFKSLAIHASLDSFWSHLTNTVKNHVREVRFIARYADTHGMEALPPMGLFEQGDHRGMLQAIWWRCAP